MSLLGWWGGGSYAAGPPGASAAVARGGPVWYDSGMKRLGGAAALVLAFVFTSTAGAVTPDYYPLPTGYLIAGGISADDHGNVWFGSHKPGPESASDAVSPIAHLGRLDTSQAIANTNGGFSFYPTPNPPGQNCCATSIRSVAYSVAEQRIYFIRSEGVYGYGVPASMVNGQPTGITDFRLERIIDLGDIAVSPAQDGGVWFTERSTSNVAIPSGPNAGQFPGARIARFAGSLAEGPNIATQFGQTAIQSLRYDAKPDGVAVDKNGIPWFVESDPGNPGYRIARYTPGADHYDEWSLPCGFGSPCSGSFTGTGPRDLTIAADGGVWFTNELKKSFGHFDPATQAMEEYTLASVDPTIGQGIPKAITTAIDGTIWIAVYGSFSAPGANSLLKIVPAATPTAVPTATVFKTDTANPPLSVGGDRSGNVWFTSANASPPSNLGRFAGVIGAAAPGPTGGTVPPVVSPPAAALKPTFKGIAKLSPPNATPDGVNLDQICVGPPEDRCSLVYIISAHEYVRGFPNTVQRSSVARGAAKAKKKPKPQVLGTKAVTLSGGQKAKVTIKLNALGKRILAKKKRLRIDVVATQKLDNGKTRVVLKKTLTMKAGTKAGKR